MTRIIDSLAEVAEGYDAVLCDLWGCYHNGIAPHAGAVNALRAFRRKGGAVVLLTNAPRPRSTILTQIEKMGAPRDSFDGIVSSGDATCAAMRTGRFGQQCYHLGPERDFDLLEVGGVSGVPLEQAEFVLCSGLFDDQTETPSDYAELFERALARDLAFVSANPDAVVDRGEKRVFCGGALAQEYERRGGKVHSFGKPHLPIYDLAFSEVERQLSRPVDRSRILALGDGPATDIAGATATGIDSMFVASGLAANALLDETGTLLSERIDSYLAEEGIAPAYLIDWLR